MRILVEVKLHSSLDEIFDSVKILGRFEGSVSFPQERFQPLVDDFVCKVLDSSLSHKRRNVDLDHPNHAFVEKTYFDGDIFETKNLQLSGFLGHFKLELLIKYRNQNWLWNNNLNWTQMLYCYRNSQQMNYSGKVWKMRQRQQRLNRVMSEKFLSLSLSPTRYCDLEISAAVSDKTNKGRTEKGQINRQTELKKENYQERQN